MAKLIYASNVSLDGCTEDARGAFDWATPDDDVFAFITDLSTTLAAVSTANTRLERHFDPGAVHDLKAQPEAISSWEVRTSRHRLSRPGWLTSATCSSGPSSSVGKPALPTDTRAEFALLDESRFSNGVVHLRYRPR